MTTNEAIKQIQGMVVGAEWLSDYQLKALEMGINALKFISYCSGWVQQWVKGEEE